MSGFMSVCHVIMAPVNDCCVDILHYCVSVFYNSCESKIQVVNILKL